MSVETEVCGTHSTAAPDRLGAVPSFASYVTRKNKPREINRERRADLYGIVCRTKRIKGVSF